MAGRPDSEPTLTIAIPFYRHLGYLAEAIDSVERQSDPRWRLLVCDDGGDDGAEELVARRGDRRMSYRRNPENLGMVHNWNRCIDGASTPFVTLLHADDRLSRDYAALVLAAAERHPGAAAFFCQSTIIDSRGRPAYSFAESVKRLLVPRHDPGSDLVLAGAPAVRSLMRGNFIVCPTLCLRVEDLGERRFSTAWKQVQDLELTTGLLMDGGRLVGVRHPAYEYRRHAESSTARQTASLLRFDEEVRLFDQVAERAEELGWTEVARVARRKRIVSLHLLYRTASDIARLRPRSALKNLRFLFRRLPLW